VSLPGISTNTVLQRAAAAAAPVAGSSTGAAAPTAAQGQRAAPKSHKARRAALMEELDRMKAVMAHSRFIADPIGTVQQHLRNTLA
jgi:hypothetical protein